MQNSTDPEVHPKPAPDDVPYLQPEQPSELLRQAALIAAPVALISMAALAKFTDVDDVSGAGCAVFIGAALYVVAILSGRDEKKKEQRKKEWVLKEAKEHTARVASSLSTLRGIPNAMENSLLQASRALERAATEFNERAYGPFWDAVERAAKHLARYYSSVRLLTTGTREYYQLLKGRSHTFPSVGLTVSDIPDAKAVVSELKRVVRMGQTDFEFANIWEHRQTRKVMIAGFETLGDAIYNIGETIRKSIVNLDASLSSDLAQLIELQSKEGEAKS